MDNVVTFHKPTPHKPVEELLPHRTASSNGSIPGFDNSAGVFESHAEVNRLAERPKDLTLHKRGSGGNVVDGNIKEAVSTSDNIHVEDSHMLKTTEEKHISETSPKQHTLSKENFDSDPGHFSSHHGHSPLKAVASGSNFDQLSPEELGLDNLSYFPDHEETALSFFSVEEADSLPPPPPCTSFSHPFAEFHHRPAPQPSLDSIVEDKLAVLEDLEIPERQPLRGLLRSHSYQNLKEEEDGAVHQYINIAQEMSSRNSVHDDFPYYRFYYNVGMIRVMYARMSKKLKRRNRLSKEMRSIDFNKLEDHERWYDRDFKIRSKDLKFCK
jgi:hypothetical protein